MIDVAKHHVPSQTTLQLYTPHFPDKHRRKLPIYQYRKDRIGIPHLPSEETIRTQDLIQIPKQNFEVTLKGFKKATKISTLPIKNKTSIRSELAEKRTREEIKGSKVEKL